MEQMVEDLDRVIEAAQRAKMHLADEREAPFKSAVDDMFTTATRITATVGRW